MRCKACDEELRDSEATRKGMFTGEYIDLCDKCFETLDSELWVQDFPSVEQLGEEFYEKDEPDYSP